MHQFLTKKDVEKLEKLLKLHKRKLIHFINELVGNYDDADDILSETYIKAFNGYSDLRDKDNILRWLHKIAYHAVIDFFRWEKRDEARLTDTTIRPGPNLEGLILSELYTLALIEELPQNYQGPLTLDTFEGLSLKEGAEHFNISLSAYKAKLYRARNCAQEKIELYL